MYFGHDSGSAAWLRSRFIKSRKYGVTAFRIENRSKERERINEKSNS